MLQSVWQRTFHIEPAPLWALFGLMELTTVDRSLRTIE
jgi:hypothetical protein